MICKTCGKDKALNIENFHKHYQNKTGFTGSCRECRNKQRNERGSKYTYFYKIEKAGEIKEGRIKASSKNQAIFTMKMRFGGWSIVKLCTFKYSKQEVVKKKRGNSK